MAVHAGLVFPVATERQGDGFMEKFFIGKQETIVTLLCKHHLLKPKKAKKFESIVFNIKKCKI